MSMFKSVKIKMSRGGHKIVKREALNGLDYRSEKDAMWVSRIYWSEFIKDDRVWWYGEDFGYVDGGEAHKGYVVEMMSGEMYIFGVEEIEG